MDKEIIEIAGAGFTLVFTVLGSGVVAAVVSHRLNREKEHTFFMRQKAEQLYLAADEFGRMIQINLSGYVEVARGKISYNQMLDIQIANPPQKKDGGAETMTMLTRIYFPEVEPALNALFAVRTQMNKLQAAHKQAYREDDGVSEEWDEAFMSMVRALADAIDRLKAAIIRSARRYATTQSVQTDAVSS